ncbi:MSS51-like protein, mitochondrial [Mycena sanguinolenta]|uniref:MSS51-like protein, mitochondrial n=1 Tax=Mycena sanguinolenta TaxID=230812 RepID=A0A8H6YI98_9AGAR|nr:MSS51-like protein, mitochondrial [Mycena sanguinolenta]
MPPRSTAASQNALIKALIDLHLKSERPNKHTDRVAWNDHFEFDIELTYGKFSYESKQFPLLENIKGHDWGDITWLNLNIANRAKELMHSEGVLISQSLENLHYGDFERKWQGLPLEKKKDLALEGLYRGACNCPWDNGRKSCPELTISSLVGDGEYSFINLLKRIVEHDPTGNRRVRELFRFRHPYVDHQFRSSDSATEAAKAGLYLIQIYRTFCIVETLKGILNAYHGVKMTSMVPIQTALPVRHGEKAEARQRQLAEQDKNSIFQEIIVDDSQCKEMAAISYTACQGCLVKTNRKHLKRCAQCQSVWYCSPQCQRKDWPEHKKACGKTTFVLPSPRAVAPDEFIGCPVAIPGFVRTPALWRQIWYLSKSDSQYSDYHFDSTSKPGDTSSLRISRPPGARLIFLVARRRAMASGSLPAIFKMLEILEFEEDSGIRTWTHARYRRQFEMEYNIQITPEAIREAKGKFSPPTATELQEEEEFLRRRWASVAHLAIHMRLTVQQHLGGPFGPSTAYLFDSTLGRAA